MAYRRNWFVYERKDGITIFYSRWQCAADLARIALEYRLFVPGWSLSYVFKEIITRPLRSDGIVLIYKDGIPVCVATVTDREYHCNNKSLLNVFCRKEYRRQGYGSLAIRHMQKHNPSRKLHPHGELRANARAFYRNNNFSC